jgi:hypothetical protein
MRESSSEEEKRLRGELRADKIKLAGDASVFPKSCLELIIKLKEFKPD